LILFDGEVFDPRMRMTKKTTPSRRTKKPVKSNKQPAKPARAAAPADPGEAAFARLKPRLAKLPADQVAQPRTDLRAAASFVLSNTVPKFKDRTLRARFATLPAAEFDHSALEDLSDAAQAVLWAQAQLAEALAGVPGTRLPLDLLHEASALRGRMLDICAYHFRGDAKLSAQTDDIRSGQGYLDLAEDLSRLAALYRAQRETLKQDLRFYRAADEGDALKLSQRIVAELRTTGPQAARESAWRSWALLNQLYEEVARGGRFLLRDDGTAFPSLHTVGRSAPRSSKKSPNAPTPTPPTPA
jgi:hypothetical protein